MISYNYGARRPGHVRKAMLLMGCFGIGYTLIVWILIERFPAFFISMFSTDAACMVTMLLMVLPELRKME